MRIELHVGIHHHSSICVASVYCYSYCFTTIIGSQSLGSIWIYDARQVNRGYKPPGRWCMVDHDGANI